MNNIIQAIGITGTVILAATVLWFVSGGPLLWIIIHVVANWR